MTNEVDEVNAWIDLIKAAIRPFIIVWGSVLYGICLIKGIEVPDLLAGLVAAFIIEYFGERAVMRFKENRGTGTKGES
jgi:hypothetical protein